MWFTKKRAVGRIFAGQHWTDLPANWSFPQLQRAFEEGEEVEVAEWAALISADLSASTESLQVIQQRRVEMYDEGFLTIPLRIAAEGQEYDLFFYPQFGKTEQVRHNTIIQLYQKLGRPVPFYIAGEPLESKISGEGLQMFDFDLLVAKDLPTENKNYCMWWLSEQEPNFIESETFSYLDRIYHAHHGIESYLFSMLVRKLVPEIPQPGARLELPGSNMSLMVDGPNDQAFVIDISRKKGLRFLFDSEVTDVAYRQTLLRHYRDFIAAFRVQFNERKFPVDGYQPGNAALDWWREVELSSKEVYEKGERIQHLSCITTGH